MKVSRKIGERGQVTLPKDLREQLGYIPNSQVFISEENGKITIEKEDEKFSEWSKKVSEKVGKLDKDIKEYRREQVTSRV